MSVSSLENGYIRADSMAFAQKTSKKIAGWYNEAIHHEKAVRRIVLQREEIYSLLEGVSKVDVQNLLMYLDSSGFFYRPSSSCRHHNFPGGLAEHSLGTYRIVEAWNNMTPSERRSSELYTRFLKSKSVTYDLLNEKMDNDDMVLAAICHDLCKADQYYFDGQTIKNHRHSHMHGRLSVLRLEQYGISGSDCQELLLAVLMHMRLFSPAKDQSKLANQNKGRSSILSVAVWAADKLDASRHPAGRRVLHL